MSGYLGSASSKLTYCGFKAYKKKDVEGCVQIRGRWYYLEENQGKTRELLGKYSVYCLGWGSNYVD